VTWGKLENVAAGASRATRCNDMGSSTIRTE